MIRYGSAKQSWSNACVMASVFLAGAAGLIRLASHVSDSSGRAEPDDYPGSGQVVSVAVTRLWVPEAMVELANDTALWTAIQSRQELCEFLSSRRMTGLWFVFSTRSRQANGRELDITYLHRPCSDSWAPRFFKDVLSLVAGGRPTRSSEDWSNATISTIPAELADCEPHQALAAILNMPDGSSEMHE